MERRIASRLQVALAALLFSTGGAAIKGCSLSGWQVAGLRSGVAALAVWLLVPAARRRWNGRIVAVAAAYAATLILFVLANKLTTAANTIFLQDTAPLYVLLLSPWLLRESIRQRDLLWMALMAVGMAFFFVGDDRVLATAPRPALGNALALTSGVTFALALIGLRFLGREETRSPDAAGAGAASVMAGNTLACLVCLPFAAPFPAARPSDWLIIVYLGTIQIGLAYLLLLRSLHSVPAFEASLLLLVEPVFNPVWVWLAQGERPGAAAICGGLLILAATILIAFTGARGRAPTPG